MVKCTRALTFQNIRQVRYYRLPDGSLLRQTDSTPHDRVVAARSAAAPAPPVPAEAAGEGAATGPEGSGDTPAAGAGGGVAQGVQMERELEMRRDASLSATERFALHKAKRAAVDARLAADKEKETNGPCGAADRDSAARQRLQSCWENRYSTAHQVQSAGVGVGAGARVGAAGLPSSCDDVASRDAVGAHRDIDAGVHGEGEVAGHIRHATYASSRDAVGARRETGSVSERDADAGVQAGGRVTGGVGHGHGRVADGAARASGSVCTGRDTQTDTSKGTSKDTSQDTSEEADKDTDKDTYTDPCTPHRGSHASAAAPAQHGESTPVNGNDARRARGASNSPPPTPSAQQHALGVQQHVTTLGCEEEEEEEEE